MRAATGLMVRRLRGAPRGFPGRRTVPRLRVRSGNGFAGVVKTKFVLILVTAPNRQTARRLARLALEARLAACANLVPGIESHYWWQGKMARSSEVLILFKTTRRNVVALERLILAEHPYDTPEFVVLSLEAGAKRYLSWIEDSVQPAQLHRRKR